jgi:hypothetical protein
MNKPDYKTPTGFNQTRAVNNVNALGESSAKSIFEAFEESSDAVTKMVAMKTPTTGSRVDRKSVLFVQAVYDLEKAYACRNSVIDRISASLRKINERGNKYGWA